MVYGVWTNLSSSIDLGPNWPRLHVYLFVSYVVIKPSSNNSDRSDHWLLQLCKEVQLCIDLGELYCNTACRVGRIFKVLFYMFSKLFLLTIFSSFVITVNMRTCSCVCTYMTLLLSHLQTINHLHIYILWETNNHKSI